MPLLLGVVVLVLVLWAANSFSKADPRRTPKLLRRVGAGAAFVFAAFLLLRGELGAAVTVGIVGLGTLGLIPFWPGGSRSWTQMRGPRVSHVRTAFIAMELDHVTGAMRGRILAGARQGAALDSLDVPTLIGLLGAMDGDSRALLAAYLDRRQPGWRNHAQDDAAAGSGRRPAGGSSKMTEQEAYQILGVAPGASAEEITRAHRSLIKKLHPDQGGSTYLAARVNDAKDVLLRRHR